MPRCPYINDSIFLVVNIRCSAILTGITIFILARYTYFLVTTVYSWPFKALCTLKITRQWSMESIYPTNANSLDFLTRIATTEVWTSR